MQDFRNELDLIKNMGGVVIWVQRGELPEWYETATPAENVIAQDNDYKVQRCT